mmetsp:Transcript_147333/g.410423  ORF Transcript_147333/g.410423 Transcript_147333/m.410423 type:complete len:207 (-) Transcript_147333:10-630(-)
MLSGDGVRTRVEAVEPRCLQGKVGGAVLVVSSSSGLPLALLSPSSEEDDEESEPDSQEGIPCRPALTSASKAAGVGGVVELRAASPPAPAGSGAETRGGQACVEAFARPPSLPRGDADVSGDSASGLLYFDSMVRAEATFTEVCSHPKEALPPGRGTNAPLIDMVRGWHCISGIWRCIRMSMVLTIGRDLHRRRAIRPCLEGAVPG